MHEGHTWLPMNQGLLQGEYKPHTLHANHMVVASTGWTRTLRHTPGSNCEYSNDYQQRHELRLHLCQVQDQEPPRHFLPNFTHKPTNCMEPLKVILDSCTPREGPIPTASHILQEIQWKQQPRGPDRFWHLYVVHALGLGMHSLHQYLLRALHRVQPPIKRRQYRSQCHWEAH